jgi:hypothetical protein
VRHDLTGRAVLWRERLPRWRELPAQVGPAVVTVTRLTTAAVLSYLLTSVLTDGSQDLTGALTALLVMQASAFSTLKMGAVRVGAVLCGVVVATLLSTWVGLTWWSLGAAIAASLLLGQVLRLGAQALETPISAMLILAVADPDIAAETRVLNTLIGAGVGIGFNLVYPPAMPTRSAVRSIVRVADATAVPLEQAGQALTEGPVTREHVEVWMDSVRTAGRDVAEATELVAALRDSRRLNPRALATRDVEPLLASGLDILDRCLLAIRALLAVVLTELPTAQRRDDPYGEDLRAAFAVVLHDVADCLRAFGRLVEAEAQDREEATERALDAQLEILRETKAILTELMLVAAPDDRSAWLLRGSILAAVEQVLDQLDLEERARARRRWKELEQGKPVSQLPELVRAALPHPERPHLRGLPPGRTWRRRRTPAAPAGGGGATGAPPAPVEDERTP